MKLKKKPKLILSVILAILVVGSSLLLVFHFMNSNTGIRQSRKLHYIEGYSYTLWSHQSKRYQELFWELVEVLEQDPVDKEAYVSLISKMFIYDFFSLDEKIASTDIGGTDFVYPRLLLNFLQNAQNTFYWHLESDIYGQRNQPGLPTVSSVEIVSIERESLEYTFEENEYIDEEAFFVTVRWDYTERMSGFQRDAVLVFVHNGIRLDLVRLRREIEE